MARKGIISLLAVLASVLSASGLPPQHNRTVSFHGGYHQETLLQNQQQVPHVSLGFRTLQDSGVLLILRQSNSTNSYIAVVLNPRNQLEVLLNQNGDIRALGSITLTKNESDWQSLQLHIVNQTLTTKLNHVNFLMHTFSAPLEIERVLFGGPESFFHPIYMNFPIPRYYIGCFNNMTLNGKEVVPDYSSPGIGPNCCIAPRYPVWCLNSSLSSLTFNLPQQSSSSVRVSFRLQSGTDEGGLVMLAHSSLPWALQLHRGQLQLLANVSEVVKTVECPGRFLALGEWNQVDIILSTDTLSCIVDGVAASVAVTTRLVGPVTLQLGGNASSSGLVGSLRRISGESFVGCFQRPRLGMGGLDLDLDPSLLVNTESRRRAIQPAPIQWSNIVYNFTDLVVSEGMEEILSPSTISLQLPHDQFSDNISSQYQLEIINAIHFQVLNGPYNGQLLIGRPPIRVQSFDYYNILSEDPNFQVRYSHNEQGNTTEVIVFKAWAGCGDTVLAERFPLPLEIYIEDQDDTLRVTHSESLHLAAGTRRVISPEILTVEDPITSDSTIIYSQQFISVNSSDCLSCQAQETECGRCKAGTIVKNGITPRFFYQQDINQGLVSFQHFERFMTTPLIIRLGVAVQGRPSRHLNTDITVIPHQGHINLTSHPATSCLFVREDNMALLQPKHLNATTDFQQQKPVITYDLLTLPRYGVLERYSPTSAQWMELSNSSTFHNSLLAETFSSFTQADINNGRVRYVQSKTYSEAVTEDFKFQVRSSNLSGPDGKLCINISPDDFLQQPSIDIEVKELVVQEGGSAPITPNVLNTSLADIDYLLLELDGDIDVQQLGIVYTLVEEPSFGSLELSGRILVAGDNFTYSDITSNSLIYVHRGSENHLDRFIFYAEASTTAYLLIRAPNRTSNRTLIINITAVNDHDPVLTALEIIRPPEGCWVSVTETNINVTDEDKPPVPLEIYLRRPRKKEEDPNGRFVFRGAFDRPISTFYMQNISDNKIIFRHTLNASAPLRYTQILRISDSDPPRRIRKPIYIEAVPLELNVEVSLLPNSCIATLDASNTSLQIRINPKLFSATLRDHFGNNANKVSDINVAISSRPSYGQIMKTSEDSQGGPTRAFVSHFRFTEIGQIIYLLDRNFVNQSGDAFELEFSYGHSIPVRHSLEVCILPVLLPLSVTVSPLRLMEGGIGHLNTTHLTVNSSREEGKGSLVFQINRKPHHGSLRNRHLDTVLTRFTYAELRSGAVIYEHFRNTSALEDDFIFSVCSSFGCSDEQLLPIQIQPTDLVVSDRTIIVTEGGQYNFTEADFHVEHSQGYFLTFSIREPPTHGVIRSTVLLPGENVSQFVTWHVRLGNIYYVHNEMETLRDSFEVSITAQNEGDPKLLKELEFIMRIKIDPVNNHDPEAITENAVVVEGSSFLITSRYLIAHDYDSHNDDNDLQWYIPQPLSFPRLGYLYLDQDPGAPFAGIRNWTERDIRNNRLFYRNTQSSGQPDLIYCIISDGERKASAILYFNIVVVNFIPCNETDSFSLKEGASKRITYDHLRYCAQNDNSLEDSNFVLTVVRTPRRGYLSLAGRRLNVNSSFTQDQIASSHLEYKHDHTNYPTDDFLFNISVPIRRNGTKEVLFEIKITPVDDDPPEACISGPILALEMGEVYLNRYIEIFDHDAVLKRERDLVVCQLVQNMTHGRVARSRFNSTYDHTNFFTKFDMDEGNVWYQHLDLVEEPDHLIFNITDGKNKQPDEYNVTIFILPREVPLRLANLTVTEGDLAPITYEELKVTHYYMRTLPGVVNLTAGPYHGSLTNANTGASNIRSFTSEDLANHSIKYFHHGSENYKDSFQFMYEVRDPAHYNRMSVEQTFYIDITPINDQGPMIADNSTRRQLWVGETVVLDESYWNVTDFDTEPEKLNFTIQQIHGLGGHIAFANDSGKPIHWFTQADIRAHKVVFNHTSSPRGNITYIVQDGTFSASGVIHIIAYPLSLNCDTLNWKSIEVDFLGKVTLTNRSLHCTTVESDRITRKITFKRLNSRLGHFEVDSKIRTNFTSTEINLGLVTFVHTETGYWKENETLLISASSPPASEKDDLALLIVVSYPRPSLGSKLAVNNRLTVLEGSNETIDESLLDGRNLRYEAWLRFHSNETRPDELAVVFRILIHPFHGDLTLDGLPAAFFNQEDLARGAVVYAHDDSENYMDEVRLNVTIEVNDTALPLYSVETFSIVATPVNDQRPTLVTTLLQKMLVKNFTSLLTRADLQISDGDNFSPSELHFLLLSLPNNTHILRSGSILTVDSSFTQQDINQDLITLYPFHTGTGSFSFKLSDGIQASNRSYQFMLTVQKHRLTLLHSKHITFFQNESSAAITTQHLDTQTNTGSLRFMTQFTVKIPPSFGRIMIGENQVRIFNQTDIDNGLVRYIPHRGSRHHRDRFTLSIANNDVSVQRVQMIVRVKAWGATSSTNSVIDFTGGQLVQPLPTDVLSLDELQEEVGQPPVISLCNECEKPRFGHLEMQVEVPVFDQRRKRFSEQKQFNFTYTELQQGWIVYVWSYKGHLVNRTVQDSFTVVVTAEGLQPGEAEVLLTLTPPQGLTTPLPTTARATTTTIQQIIFTSTSLPTTANQNSFPLYTLVPVIGIIFILIILIVIVVIFCLTQQKHLKKKLIPGVSQPRHPSPWSPTPPAHLTHYDLDPSAIPASEEDSRHNSETSSGFSEPEVSPRHTPTHSFAYHPSPSPSSAYRDPPSRSRMRSNVSITLSSRQSNVSEMSLEGDDPHHLHSYSLPHYSTQTAPSPLPVRPASNTAFTSRPPVTNQSSSVTHNSSEGDKPVTADEHSDCTPAAEDASLEWMEGKPLPDLNNPDIQKRLFHSHNPILKKEEYWV